MERVKTKQEQLKTWRESWDIKETPGYNHIKRYDLFGLEYNADWQLHPDFRTTDPHPFDSMDIKVRVTPKQSKKLHKKAEKMGYSPAGVCPNDDFICIKARCFGSYRDNQNLDWIDSYTELTYKQFMNGTVPKKKGVITADEIIKPEVMERLKEVTILSTKACKSIKDVEEAYASLQNTIKEL